MIKHKKIKSDLSNIMNEGFIHGSFPQCNAQWIWHPDSHGTDYKVLLFKRSFTLNKTETIRLHVSADQRFELFADGELVGRGPERGDRFNWFIHSYEIKLPKGKHTLTVRCWWIGDMAPFSQITLRGGFLLCAEGKMHDFLSTGTSNWRVADMDGYKFKRSEVMGGSGTQAETTVNAAALPADYRKGTGIKFVRASCNFKNVESVEESHVGWWWKLTPSTLPEMLNLPVKKMKVFQAELLTKNQKRNPHVKEENNHEIIVEQWQNLLDGKKNLIVPKNSRIRILIDLNNYYCAYPSLLVNKGKGSSIDIQWSESLFEKLEGFTKGNRNEVYNKIFHGEGDQFMLNGKKTFLDVLWWRAGRYVEIFVKTADEKLKIEKLNFNETHYPFKKEAKLSTSDKSLTSFFPIAWRTMEMCSHETYMDCPYYEQLMYIGDTRLEVLVNYVMTSDDHLPEKALKCFDMSRKTFGLTQSRYPCRYINLIPPFSLWLICMTHDHFMWRDNPDLIRNMLPGADAIIAHFHPHVNKNNLLDYKSPWWEFVDWVPDWFYGTPSGTKDNISGILNLQYILSLKAAAEMHKHFGEKFLADEYFYRADKISKAFNKKFWSEKRGLFAHDVKKKNFSEHAQCLAVIADVANRNQINKISKSIFDDDLDKTTIYFSHYLLETLPLIGKMDNFIDKIDFWRDLDKQGFKTLPEAPHPCRSDCHAWGAHPIYHFYTKLLGITPKSPGFKEIRIKPYLCGLTEISGSMPHPKGKIEVNITTKEEKIAIISIPKGTTGEFIWGEKIYSLKAGKQKIKF